MRGTLKVDVTLLILRVSRSKTLSLWVAFLFLHTSPGRSCRLQREAWRRYPPRAHGVVLREKPATWAEAAEIIPFRFEPRYGAKFYTRPPPHP